MEKKTSKNVVLYIMGVLVLAEMGITLYNCLFYEYAIFNLFNLLALVGVALYGFWFYKKPHGNMLKYAMILNAVAIVASTVLSVYQWEDPFYEIFSPIIAACVIFYVAGRLNRIEENKYLLTIVAFILFVICLIDWISFPAFGITDVLIYLRVANEFVTFITLCCAYFTRFQEHKEAGLADK